MQLGSTVISKDSLFFIDCSLKALANCQRVRRCITSVHNISNACITSITDTCEVCIAGINNTGEVMGDYWAISTTPVRHVLTDTNVTCVACLAVVIDTSEVHSDTERS